jgi:Na+/H+ antiporter NhaD/arsenite permease-like protein
VPIDAVVAARQTTWPVLLFLVVITLVSDLCADAAVFDVAAHLFARAVRHGLAVERRVAAAADLEPEQPAGRRAPPPARRRPFVADLWLPQLVVLAVVLSVLVLRHGRAISGRYVVPRVLPAHDGSWSWWPP